MAPMAMPILSFLMNPAISMTMAVIGIKTGKIISISIFLLVKYFIFLRCEMAHNVPACAMFTDGEILPPSANVGELKASRIHIC